MPVISDLLACVFDGVESLMSSQATLYGMVLILICLFHVNVYFTK